MRHLYHFIAPPCSDTEIKATLYGITHLELPFEMCCVQSFVLFEHLFVELLGVLLCLRVVRLAVMLTHQKLDTPDTDVFILQLTETP